MPHSWQCQEKPASHGAFLQTVLDEFAEKYPDLQVMRPYPRYACPKCVAQGRPGWVTPGFTDAARLAAPQEN